MSQGSENRRLLLTASPSSFSPRHLAPKEKNASVNHSGASSGRSFQVIRMAAKGRSYEQPKHLDFNSFRDFQSIFELDAEIPDCAVHLGMAQ